MPVDTFEQPAQTPAADGQAPAQQAADQPTADDVSALTGALRGLMIQAKNRHRAIEKSSDHGRTAMLFILSKNGPMRASSLAKEAALDLSTISRHLRALEEEGYIAKTADPDDKRAFQVGLTERGHDFVRQYWRDRVATLRNALAAWTADDVRALTKLLDRFVRDTEGCF
jgi:DNA-binding MarR family transcriptional regulator